MKNWKRMRSFLARTVDILFFMVAGAWFFTWYIDASNPSLASQLRDSERFLGIAFWVLLISHHAVQEKKEDPANTFNEPSPRWSGIAVVLSVGLVAAISVGRSSGEFDLVITGLIVGATFITAAIVWSFATKQASEIGEARFRAAGQDRSPATGG